MLFALSCYTLKLVTCNVFLYSSLFVLSICLIRCNEISYNLFLYELWKLEIKMSFERYVDTQANRSMLVGAPYHIQIGIGVVWY